MDKFIVNRHGVIHSIPGDMLAQAESQGGRLATDEELIAAGFLKAPAKPKATRAKRSRAKSDATS